MKRVAKEEFRPFSPLYFFFQLFLRRFVLTSGEKILSDAVSNEALEKRKKKRERENVGRLST